jgi:membrane associated rhomboid family serine protease
MILTVIITIITVLISMAAFNNADLVNKLILWPRYMDNPKEYYRLLTSGFIHADWNHLIFNMVSLYFIGQSAEMLLGGGIITLYLTGIIVSSLPSFIKNRNNSYYRSLGASGGVSSILFLVIYFFPWGKLQIIFIPIGIPCIIYGVLYLIYEAYMSKRGQGNVNHDAHFWGAIYGFLYAIVIDPSHGLSFFNQVMHPY